ncbi:hypothetical protein DL96DRAFT_1285423 [Flagelloscypha sp. PMI_526]|nr:hypothetical protein DL96DRAFT_1285423 [Flagelloscypha sp. PMI_526]
MKIPLLTKLFHRRTRSDTSAVLQAQAQARGAAAFSRDDLLPASLSLPAIPEDALCDAGFVQPQNYHSSRQDPGPLFSFAPIPPTLVTQHMSLLERIQALEQENAHIQELNQDIRTRMETTSTRLAALRSEYYTERATAIVHNRALKHAQISRKSVAESLIHLEKTCDALVKMTVLVDPVLVRAKDSILTGNPAEQAFAESLQAAASDPRSPWSSLFPAIQEQRMTSHHANALTLASKTNHQLESVTMRRSFWKHLALGQTPVVFSMTPSASALSSLGFGSASHRLALTLQRRLAVEALLQRRRQEQQVRRTRMVTHPGRQLPSPSMTSSNLAAIVQLPPISPAVLKLPPLASQTFKQELIASYSSERFSLRLPKTVPSHSISLPSTQAVEDSRETLPSPQKPSSFQVCKIFSIGVGY